MKEFQHKYRLFDAADLGEIHYLEVGPMIKEINGAIEYDVVNPEVIATCVGSLVELFSNSAVTRRYIVTQAWANACSTGMRDEKRNRALLASTWYVGELVELWEELIKAYDTIELREEHYYDEAWNNGAHMVRIGYELIDVAATAILALRHADFFECDPNTEAEFEKIQKIWLS